MALNVLDRLVDYYHENKISHVYLVETNNVELCLEDLKKIVKQIFCAGKYQENCTVCNICNLIDQNYLPSLAIIEPDGSTIKKEQILELKRNFSTVPIYTKDNIYIIKNAEAMTQSSANTMLKFLEEPEEHIMGFFITSNLNNVIPTIRSRCEVIKAMYDVHELNIDSVFDDSNSEFLNIAMTYLEKLEVEKKDSIMYNRSILLGKISAREDIKKLFQIILIIYEEFLKNSLNLPSKYQKFAKNNFLSSYNSKALLKRVNLVAQFLEDISSNVNLELLLDKFVIDLGDVDE